jgi:hypothetical protein
VIGIYMISQLAKLQKIKDEKDKDKVRASSQTERDDHCRIQG